MQFASQEQTARRKYFVKLFSTSKFFRSQPLWGNLFKGNKLRVWLPTFCHVIKERCVSTHLFTCDCSAKLWFPAHADISMQLHRVRLHPPITGVWCLNLKCVPQSYFTGAWKFTHNWKGTLAFFRTLRLFKSTFCQVRL